MEQISRLSLALSLIRHFDLTLLFENLRLTGGTSNLALDIEWLVTIVGEELLLLLLLLFVAIASAGRPTELSRCFGASTVQYFYIASNSLKDRSTCNRPRANYFVICTLGTSVTYITSFVIFLRGLSTEKY